MSILFTYWQRRKHSVAAVFTTPPVTQLQAAGNASMVPDSFSGKIQHQQQQIFAAAVNLGA